MVTVAALAVGSLLVVAVSAPWPAQGQSLAPAPQAPSAVQWSGSVYGQYGGYALHGQAAELARQYVKAEKEEDKREIRKKLTDVLNKEFDARLQQQQKELEELEKQIAHLRTVLRKRSDAKDKIIDRRADQLIEDAEGMGWSAPTTPHTGYGPGQINLLTKPAYPNPPTEKGKRPSEP
jgi:hypothetical protein